MEYKKLIIRGISYSQSQSNAYALILEESQTGIKLPIVIGAFEAQSISMGLEKDLKTPRPLTHDLFANFVESTHYTLDSVVIYNMKEGVFFSNINFVNKIIGDSITLDARTSDAVAIAVRFNAPIYTLPEIINEAGILLELENHDLKEEEAQPVQKSIIQLQAELEEAVKNEDFDLALRLQEEIKDRHKKID